MMMPPSVRVADDGSFHVSGVCHWDSSKLQFMRAHRVAVLRLSTMYTNFVEIEGVLGTGLNIVVHISAFTRVWTRHGVENFSGPPSGARYRHPSNCREGRARMVTDCGAPGQSRRACTLDLAVSSPNNIRNHFLIKSMVNPLSIEA
jgi:hypothetical protein